MTKLRFLLCLLSTVGACGDAANTDTPDASPEVDAPLAPEPEPDPVDVTLTLEDPPDVAFPLGTFVAFQDGTGAWSKLEGTGGVYRARTTTGRFGFLVVCADGDDPSYTRIFYQTTADGTDMTQRSCSSVWGLVLPHTITGALTRPAGEEVRVQTSSGNGYVDLSEPTVYVAGALPGETDLVLSGSSDGERWRFIRRELGMVDSDRTIDIDMAEALPGELGPISLAGLTAADTSIGTASAILGGVGARAPVGRYDLPGRIGPDALAHRLPAALRKPDDVIALYARVEQLDTGAPLHIARESYDEASIDQTLPALPEVIPFTPPTLDADPTTPWTFALPRVPLTRPSRLFLVSDSLTLVASADWVTATETLAVQNPTSLPGWRAAWNISATDWLWIAYETTTGTQMTSSGLTGEPGNPAARRRSPTLDDVARRRDQVRLIPPPGARD